MTTGMNLARRREILAAYREQYAQSSRERRIELVDQFTAQTGYERKYALKLLNSRPTAENKQTRSGRQRVYDEQVQEILVVAWRAANCICSKRLQPFLPELLAVLEKNGHIELSDSLRKRVIGLSAATIDRLLSPVRSNCEPLDLRYVDRFISFSADRNLANRYFEVVRQYLMFFQPSLKLVGSESSSGTRKNRYELTTMYDRCLSLPGFAEDRKLALAKSYESIDPIMLLGEIKHLREQLSTHPPSAYPQVASFGVRSAAESISR